MRNLIIFIFLITTTFAFSQIKKLSNKDLFTLGKVWGEMKYYQPVISQGKIDWDAALLNTLEKQKSKKKSVDEIINEWFALTEKQTADNIESDVPKHDSITSRNYDFSWIKKSKILNNINKTRLLQLIKTPVNIGNYYSNPEFKSNRYNSANEKSYSISNEKIKLLELFRLWNVIEYFYPYKYLLDNSWDNILKKYIPLFRNSKSHLDYEKVLTLFSAKIQDTHVEFSKTYNYDIFGKLTAPFTVQIIDNGAIITKIKDKKIAEESNIEVGDFITKINGKTIQQIISENSKYIPASNKSVVIREAYNYLFSGNKKQFTIEAEKENGKKYRSKISRVTRIFRNEWDKDGIPDYHLHYKNKDYEYSVFDTNLGRLKSSFRIGNKAYIDFSSLIPKEIDSLMVSLKDTKGIVFDLRGYNDDGGLLKVFNHLFASPQFFGIKTQPDFGNPGKFYFVDNIIDEKYKFVGENNPSPYNGKVIVLINENTQSAEEMWGMVFKKVPNVIFVGSQTAGADGNKTAIKMTNGNELKFSGLGIYYPDGKETQRIGIKPDVFIKPTKESIRKKEDLLLAKAFELIDAEK